MCDDMMIHLHAHTRCGLHFCVSGAVSIACDIVSNHNRGIWNTVMNRQDSPEKGVYTTKYEGGETNVDEGHHQGLRAIDTQVRMDDHRVSICWSISQSDFVP